MPEFRFPIKADGSKHDSHIKYTVYFFLIHSNKEANTMPTKKKKAPPAHGTASKKVKQEKKPLDNSRFPIVGIGASAGGLERMGVKSLIDLSGLGSNFAHV